MADSWHVEHELERLEHRPCPLRLDLEQLAVGQRLAHDLAVARGDVVTDEERVGERTSAGDAPPDKRLRV
jgi:hypothetical protein